MHIGHALTSVGVGASPKSVTFMCPSRVLYFSNALSRCCVLISRSASGLKCTLIISCVMGNSFIIFSVLCVIRMWTRHTGMCDYASRPLTELKESITHKLYIVK